MVKIIQFPSGKEKPTRQINTKQSDPLLPDLEGKNDLLMEFLEYRESLEEKPESFDLREYAKRGLALAWTLSDNQFSQIKQHIENDVRTALTTKYGSQKANQIIKDLQIRWNLEHR